MLVTLKRGLGQKRKMLNKRPGIFIAVLIFIFVMAFGYCLTLIYSSPTIEASPMSITWTTKGDFDSNASTTGSATTKTSAKSTGSSATDDADIILTDPTFRVAQTAKAAAYSPISVEVNPNDNGFHLTVSGYHATWYFSSVGAWPVSTGGTMWYSAVNKLTDRTYLTARDDGTDNVYVYDHTSNVGTITLSDEPYGVAVNDASNKVYVSSITSNNVTAVNGSDNQVLDTIPVGNYPRSLAVQANKVYVANYNSGTVSVIDSSTDTFIKDITVGGSPYEVAANPSTNKVYVTNPSTQSIAVINSVIDEVADTISAIASPDTIAIDSVSNKIYVHGFNSSTTTSVLDGNSHTVLGEASLNAIDLAVSTTNGWVYGATGKLYGEHKGVTVAYDAYPATGSASGFKVNAGSTTSWKSLSYNATTPDNTTLQFKVRSADTEEGLDSESWNTVFQSGSNLEEVAPISKWLEIQVNMTTSDGLYTPTLKDFTVNYSPVTVSSSECKPCHNDYPSDQFDKHLETNNVTLNSCSDCHSVWGGVHSGAAYQTSYGYFESADSLNSTAEAIHSKHIDEHMDNDGGACTEQSGCHHYGSGYSSDICAVCHPPPIGGGTGNCKNCHFSADCSTCHTSDPAHEAHTSVTPRSIKVSTGSGYQTKDLTCLNSNCHDATFVDPPAESDLTETPACLNCHTTSKAGHGNAETEHTYSRLSTNCKSCHYSSVGVLSVYHQRKGKNCLTCHQSSDSDVQDAINNNKKNCNACHTTGNSGHGQKKEEHKDKNLPSTCGKCHNSSLSYEHQRRGVACSACHINEKSTNNILTRSSSASIQSSDTGFDQTSCNNCHSGHPTTDDNCSACHGQNTTCTTCHTDKETHTTKTECNDCHTNAFGIHHASEQSQTKDCITCHSTITHSPDNENTTCLFCHKNAQHSIDVSKGALMASNDSKYNIEKALKQSDKYSLKGLNSAESDSKKVLSTSTIILIIISAITALVILGGFVLFLSKKNK